MNPELFASGGGPTQAPPAAPYLGPVDNPNFSKYTLPPNAQTNQFPVQPYTIYAPLKDPLALGGLGEAPQQFSNPAANPAHSREAGSSAAPMQFYQQNLALGTRVPGDRDLPAHRGFPHGANTLYDQVQIPLGGTAQDFQYPGSPSPNSSDTDNELLQRYPRTSNFPTNTTSQKYNGYESNLDRRNENPSSDPWENNMYPRSSASPYNSDNRAGGYSRGLSRDIERERTNKASAYPRNDRHSRYPSDPEQPYQTSELSRDPVHSRFVREDGPPSVLPSDIEPLPDY